MLTDEKIEQMATALAARIAARIESPPPAASLAGRPRLIVPEHVRPTLVDPTRAARERRIRFIVNRYGLHWLVDQHTEGEVEDMGEEQLQALGADCERALKAVLEGVSFEDIGLVRWSA